MPKPKELVAEIQAYCKANQNPALVQKYARYFKEGFDCWGLMGSHKHPLFTTKQQEWLKRYRDIGIPGFFEAGEILFAGGKYEEGAMAIRFLKELHGELNAGALDGLARWFRGGIANWAHSDVLCGEILGPLLADGRIKLAALGPWRASEFKFQRRAVPVAMLSLLKTDHAIRPLLDFIKPQMLDPERVVHQGVGWFLREAWKKEPKLVEAFLKEWKDRSPRLIFQYATEKMKPEVRERFRAAKAPAKKKAASKK